LWRQARQQRRVQQNKTTQNSKEKPNKAAEKGRASRRATEKGSSRLSNSHLRLEGPVRKHLTQCVRVAELGRETSAHDVVTTRHALHDVTRDVGVRLIWGLQGI
jgi:hypothetical protein